MTWGFLASFGGLLLAAGILAVIEKIRKKEYRR